MVRLVSSISIGEGFCIDEGAIVGYKPSRDIGDESLVIGKGAVIRSGSIIYGGSVIGDGFETGHGVVIREENRIGDNFKVWNNSTIDYGCIIGNNVKIHCNVYVAQYSIIEDDVFIAPGVLFANDLHPLCTLCMKGPTIKKGARVGIGAVLLPHVVIGEGALVGAGAVVVSDVPSYSVVVGNPARVIKRVNELECKMGLKEKAYGGGDL